MASKSRPLASTAPPPYSYVREDLAPTTAPQTLVIHDFPNPATARALSANGSHGHWSARARAKVAVMVVVTCVANMQRLRPVHVPVRLTFRWGFPYRRKRDIDNLISNGVTKATIDGLVRGGWLVADDSEHVVAVTAEVFVNKGGRRIEVVIEPATRTDAAGHGERRSEG